MEQFQQSPTTNQSKQFTPKKKQKQKTNGNITTKK